MTKPKAKTSKKTTKRPGTKKAAKSTALKKRTKNTKPKPVKKPASGKKKQAAPKKNTPILSGKVKANHIEKLLNPSVEKSEKEQGSEEQDTRDFLREFDAGIKEIFDRRWMLEAIVSDVNSKRVLLDGLEQTLGVIRTEAQKIRGQLSKAIDFERQFWERDDKRTAQGLPPLRGNDGGRKREEHAKYIDDLEKRLVLLDSVIDYNLPESVICDGETKFLSEVEGEIQEKKEKTEFLAVPPAAYVDGPESGIDKETGRDPSSSVWGDDQEEYEKWCHIPENKENILAHPRKYGPTYWVENIRRGKKLTHRKKDALIETLKKDRQLFMADW